MIQICEIENIKIPSINKRYYKNFSLTKEYKAFKQELFYSFITCQIDPPYAVHIIIETYLDIDNIIKPVLDTMQDRGIITDDRYIVNIQVSKIPIKKGRPGKITVYAETAKS